MNVGEQLTTLRTGMGQGIWRCVLCSKEINEALRTRNEQLEASAELGGRMFGAQAGEVRSGGMISTSRP